MSAANAHVADTLFVRAPGALRATLKQHVLSLRQEKHGGERREQAHLAEMWGCLVHFACNDTSGLTQFLAPRQAEGGSLP
jgi:hypothetical protein